MWQQFVGLFSDYGLIAMIVMLFGLFMCMIEVVIPGFGVFGILGTIFTFGGVVARIIMGTTGLQILSMLILIVAVVVVSLILVTIFAKAGILSKSALVQDKTVVPVDYEKPTKEQRKLIGKVGFAYTVFKPSGKMQLDGKIYDAVSNEYIEKGEKIKVVEIKNNSIVVKKV